MKHEGSTGKGSDDYARERAVMIDRHLRGRDIVSPVVLDAMRTVPRHEFVPAELRDLAYGDRPLPIGGGQTISQPYIVALMTQLAQPQPQSRVLDVGTGSGYQAAVLAELAEHVFSIEIDPALAAVAAERLASLGYGNVEVRCGDGHQGWPEHAPYDVIIVAAAPSVVPQPLIDQLAPGGRLVIPVGSYSQQLVLLTRESDDLVTETVICPVAFVPMTGGARSVI